MLVPMGSSGVLGGAFAAILSAAGEERNATARRCEEQRGEDPDSVIPGWSEGPDLRCAIAHRGISRFRVRCFASPRTDNLDHAAPSRIGGWNESAVSHGKKIQVSCDTSVMKVSTSGRPIGLA